MSANAAERLLQHYVDKSRVLPWRSPPGLPPPDPYRVWLSEVMLQQTTVAAVTPRFERFVARWPTVRDLASAAEEDVLSEWAGLGYYARARNLVACARELASRERFPDTEAELRQLPGIGDYTAAAIAAIAFGRHAVVIDSNVERVVARFRGFEHPMKADIRDAAAELTPAARAGDFAQAMMDLGATLCTPRAPRCEDCPLSDECAAFASGSAEAFPAKKARKDRPLRHGIAHWIERNGAIRLVRRPPKGLLGGMAALPGGAWTTQRPALEKPPLASVRHLFTHFTLELVVIESTEQAAEGWWQSVDSLGSAGLPTLYRRAAERVLSRRHAIAA